MKIVLMIQMKLDNNEIQNQTINLKKNRTVSLSLKQLRARKQPALPRYTRPLDHCNTNWSDLGSEVTAAMR